MQAMLDMDPEHDIWKLELTWRSKVGYEIMEVPSLKYIKN